MAALPVKSAILDGEIVCLDGDGRSLFLDLLRRRRNDAVFYAFYLLWHDVDDLRGLPLVERKRRLRWLIRASRSPSLLFADHVERYRVRFFKALCQRVCEGMAAKHKRAAYRVAGWFKILNPEYTQKRGRREMFESFRERSEHALYRRNEFFHDATTMRRRGKIQSPGPRCPKPGPYGLSPLPFRGS